MRAFHLSTCVCAHSVSTSLTVLIYSCQLYDQVWYEIVSILLSLLTYPVQGLLVARYGIQTYYTCTCAEGSVYVCVSSVVLMFVWLWCSSVGVCYIFGVLGE